MANAGTTTNPRTVTLASLDAATYTNVAVAVDLDELVIGLHIQQSGGAVQIVQLDDDAAHRLGVDLIEAARRLTTYGDDD